MKFKIAPSVLSADFAQLREQVQAVEAAGADQIHVDVMDGHFVPNLTMGPLVVDALRRSTDLPLDVHLMILEPERFVDAFIDAGASHISFHIEVCDRPAALAERLRKRGVGAGLAVNPETEIRKVTEFLPFFDMMLVMTVNPGFGGQKFLGDNLEKVRYLQAQRCRLGSGGESRGEACFDIEVDGGINRETASEAYSAGANVFVAGSYIFSAPDPAMAIRELRSIWARPGP